MTVLIIVLITLSLMGSALWIVPSKQDRRRMALRMLAMQHHFTVKLTSIGLPDKWDKSKEVHKVCSYALYRAKPVEKMSDKALLVTYDVWKYQQVASGWWCDKSLPLSEQDKAYLALLLPCVKAIEISRQSIIVYWQEDGDEDVVEAMAKLLSSLATIPSF